MVFLYLFMINATNYSTTSINATNYSTGSIGATDHKTQLTYITAGDTTVTAGSTTYNARGLLTTVNEFNSVNYS